MDNNIIQSVYDSLENSTNEISTLIAECTELETKINSNIYTQQALNNTYYPKRDALRKQIQDDSEKAIKAAQALIEQYRQDAEEQNCLDPAELTDDVKLLQPGITLLPRDLKSILKRNEDNRTMTQIILRYAEEHGINLDGLQFVETQQEEQTAKSLEAILYYYKNWIDKPDAKKMLKKFFEM
jgi:hypothetical protein